MNTNSSTRKPTYVLPLLAGAACVLLGLALLRPDTAPRTGDVANNKAPATTATPHPTRATASSTPAAEHSPKPSKEPTRTVQPSTDAMVPGDGPAGDYAVQQLLDRASPADLPRAQEKELVTLASRIWRAETTGRDRGQWPKYFGDQALRAPYQDVRIQAGIARTASGDTDRVRVRLVWAGTDPSGREEDGRSAQVLLELHSGDWEPTR
ncbi:hypothetical protein ACFQ7F_34685 [Streptomyces sp. NPDC056486]|uniref:hypothetical protein n=1 Tax=Streptomyces sp. NPDC056486 TaxID=3345835 RepID=UPI0036B61FC2